MLSVQSISSANRGFVSGANARNNIIFSSLSRTSYSNATCLYAPPSIEFCRLKGCSRLVHNATKREICPPVCASREKGNSMSGNEIHGDD
ncbi:hypothetical protein Cni_G29175 [Canna indica]|uniref:Uncharacterized protein n=1 Tax=Canna indica TaxID=4628 RepID=A0AAQ3QTR6_9LILI|nr:hypothetical protein Cni_G29175 [Canna indica]